MTKLPVVSSKKVIKVLRSAGFEDAPKRGKGKSFGNDKAKC